MSRPLRIENPDARYHIMNRGGRYKAIFEDRMIYSVVCTEYNVSISDLQISKRGN